ncbi:MAG: threonine ammonia-lyase [Deltaproteobacteria bacterium]|nr:threonine ammonia-lyase [Deltaproteobacteria bacterium]
MLKLIKEAAERLAPVLSATPVIFSSSLTDILGFPCHLKLENLQKTGSFKSRGAYNKIASLTPEEKTRGVVTASSGNHAQGVAWASSRLGINSTVVMPETTPINKYTATRGYGAAVVFWGASFDEAYAKAKTLAEEKNLTLIPPFDDEIIIAGQGTIGLELMSALTSFDTVIAPVGGGGLISGIACALKESGPDVKIIGVKAEGDCAIADGIAVKKLGDITSPLIQRHVDSVVSVSEAAIAAAILILLERKKLVVEGAGAVTVAAALEKKLPHAPKKAVFILSGGNIDVTTLDRVLRLGLLKEGRVVRISTNVPDRPGSLAALTSIIASCRANILRVAHERDAVDSPIGSTKLDIILEVEGREHAKRIFKTLRENGYEI